MWKLVTIFQIIVIFSDTSVFALSGGHDSNITRHPWLASLQHNGEHFCGATLLRESATVLQWALTSAYCATVYTTNITIKVGSSFRSTEGVVHQLEKIIIHRDYNHNTLENNIALIKTAEGIWADHTNGIDLPRINKPLNDKQAITVTGWGKTNTSGNYSEILQMMQLPYRTLEHCRNNYKNSTITANMFCAGWTETGNSTACPGDYGGPGVLVSTIYGVQSWGKSCGVAKYPTVFVNVVNYLHWIKDNTGIDVYFGKCKKAVSIGRK